MAKKFLSAWFFAPLETEDVPGGLLSKPTTIANQRSVDFDVFANELEGVYEKMDEQGYDVIQVVPITMGQSEISEPVKKHTQELGFSITRGAVIVGKLRNNESAIETETPDFSSTGMESEIGD